MKPPITKLPTSKSFLNLPILLDWSNLKHQAVVFGAPFGKPYSTVEFPNNQSTAPDKLRDASSRILVDPHSVDLDLLSGSTLASISVADASFAYQGEFFPSGAIIHWLKVWQWAGLAVE